MTKARALEDDNQNLRTEVRDAEALLAESCKAAATQRATSSPSDVELSQQTVIVAFSKRTRQVADGGTANLLVAP